MRYFVAAVLILAGLTGGMVWSKSFAEGPSVNAEIVRKLDSVIRSQNEVLAAVNSLKEDMRVIKIRITQSQ